MRTNWLITNVLSVSTAKPAQQFGYAMYKLNHYHYSFLKKLISYTVYKHRKICICMTKRRAAFATAECTIPEIGIAMYVLLFWLISIETFAVTIIFVANFFNMFSFWQKRTKTLVIRHLGCSNSPWRHSRVKFCS